MLDDLKLIHDRDKEDALGVAEKQWQQLQYDYGVNTDFSDIRNIVIAGMGGSAFPAVFLHSWPGTKAPMEIVRDYNLPDYIDEHTLFISSSYSGNTEETLSALAEAESRNARIAVVTAGGKLLDQAKAKNYPVFVIPGGIQPRMCSFYFLAAYVQLLEPLGLVKEGSIAEMAVAGDWLKDHVGEWQSTVPTDSNPAKKLALELVGKSVVVYSGPKLFPSANKFKICMNENAKNVAWVNQYPEFNHNEFMGWTSHPTEKPYAVVEIRSNLEHERIQKRFEISTQLLSGKRPDPQVITPEGDNIIQQLIWTSNYCDYASLYVALLNGVDPTPVDLVEKLKHLLG